MKSKKYMVYWQLSWENECIKDYKRIAKDFIHYWFTDNLSKVVVWEDWVYIRCRWDVRCLFTDEMIKRWHKSKTPRKKLNLKQKIWIIKEVITELKKDNVTVTMV